MAPNSWVLKLKYLFIFSVYLFFFILRVRCEYIPSHFFFIILSVNLLFFLYHILQYTLPIYSIGVYFLFHMFGFVYLLSLIYSEIDHVSAFMIKAMYYFCISIVNVKYIWELYCNVTVFFCFFVFILRNFALKYWKLARRIGNDCSCFTPQQIYQSRHKNALVLAINL